MSLADKKIIRIEPTNPGFSITWNLGLRCNFDCMYCPTWLHNTTDSDSSFKELQNKWLNIFSKTQPRQLKYKIAFTGGEVTVNKSFLPFLQWLDRNYQEYISEIGFTTNGSANKKYYSDALAINSVTFISFSTHSEFFNEKKFFDTVISVHKRSLELKKSIHVNIMDEYWNKEKSTAYSDFLTNRKINNSINKLDYSQKIREDFKINPNKKEFNFNG